MHLELHSVQRRMRPGLRERAHEKPRKIRFTLLRQAALFAALLAALPTLAGAAVVVPRAATVPDAPSSVLTSIGNGSITVTWTAPASDGGSPITSYTAAVLPSAKSCTTSTLSCTITGLSNGTIYTVNVVAKNAVGTSAGANPLIGTGASAVYATTLLSTGLNYPQCAQVDTNGNLLVADFYNSRILAFTGPGAPLEAWGPYGPGCVVSDAAGNLFANDYDGNLKELTVAGTEVTLLTGIVPGSAALTIDASGTIYVGGVGPNHADVVKLTPSGSTFTQSIVGSGFNDPNGLALDDQGNLYVGDGGAVDPTGVAAADAFIYKVAPD